jgi:hypothetical protein
MRLISEIPSSKAASPAAAEGTVTFQRKNCLSDPNSFGPPVPWFLLANYRRVLLQFGNFG